MKKKKLNLKALQVSSFVTSLSEPESAEMKGGTEVTCQRNCETAWNCTVTRGSECYFTRPPECNQWSVAPGCDVSELLCP